MDNLIASRRLCFRYFWFAFFFRHILLEQKINRLLKQIITLFLPTSQALSSSRVSDLIYEVNYYDWHKTWFPFQLLHTSAAITAVDDVVADVCSTPIASIKLTIPAFQLNAELQMLGSHVRCYDFLWNWLEQFEKSGWNHCFQFALSFEVHKMLNQNLTIVITADREQSWISWVPTSPFYL